MQQATKTWIDEIEKQNLSIDDIERSVNYARDLTQGLAKIKKFPRGVTIFGSARLKEDDPYYAHARALGRLLAENGHAVVTGGALGIMEAGNRGAFEAGGTSIGLNIQLPNEQHLNQYTTDSQEFRYFFARKVMLVFSAKVYVYFPGGFGTLDELSEVLTLIQTHKIPPAPIVLIGESFWRPLDDWFASQMQTLGTIGPNDRDLYMITDDINVVIDLANQVAPRTTAEVVEASRAV